ncbi:MAG: hypothetical protein WC955_08820 [Elusimicrobiota bacterium]
MYGYTQESWYKINLKLKRVYLIGLVFLSLFWVGRCVADEFGMCSIIPGIENVFNNPAFFVSQTFDNDGKTGLFTEYRSNYEKGNAFGIFAGYSDSGSIDAYDEYMSKTGSYSVIDLLAGIVFINRLLDKVDSGVAVRLTGLAVDNEYTFGYGLDAGVRSETAYLGIPLIVAVGINNFGKTIRGNAVYNNYHLVKVGLVMLFNNIESSVGVDTVTDFRSAAVVLSVEKMVFNILTFSLGYRFDEMYILSGSGVSFGLGVKYLLMRKEFVLFYSWSQEGFSSLNRVSLRIGL